MNDMTCPGGSNFMYYFTLLGVVTLSGMFLVSTPDPSVVILVLVFMILLVFGHLGFYTSVIITLLNLLTIVVYYVIHKRNQKRRKEREIAYDKNLSNNGTTI